MHCRFCTRSFATYHGLRVHRSKKHPDIPYEVNEEIRLDIIHEQGEEIRDIDSTDRMGDENADADRMGDENTESLSEIYLNQQISFMGIIYGEEALYSKTWEEYSEHLRTSLAHRNGKRKIAALKIYDLFKKTSLTNLEAENHLKLYHELVDIQGCQYSYNMEDHHSAIPTSWEQVKSIVELSGITVIHEEVVPWPTSWRMDKWNTTLSGAPKCVSLILLDPIQLISQQFLNPEIVYGYQKHIQFTYKAEYIKDEHGLNEQVYGNLTSSNWFRDTQNSIRKTTGNPSAEVLPISLYSDGVEVGPNRSVVSVLGTCGLYSDELQRKHLAKFCLGYIKELDNVPLSTIERHLQTYAGYTITGASDALKEFKATISQTFWAALTTSIKAHHQNGIKMRVLCHEKVHEMYPVLAFVIGDEPAQHAVTSVKQNNTKRPCNQCTYCPADRIEYSEDAFPFRDHDEMKELCPIASEGYLRLQDHKLTQSLASKKVRKQRSAEILSEEETDAIIRLKSLSVHPRVNPFHDVPMGFNNNIYCTPNDPFHVYCAGLMKAAVGWILLIVTTIGTLDERLRGASAILDNRLDTFPYCPVLPHVPNTYFRNGLTYCVDGKSKREKQNATGSLGGFRSSHYITALIHLYLAIGYNGDILPNDNEFKHGDIEYGNPTAKVFNSILALLDVYFQCKQNYFSDRQIKKLELDMRSSNAHFHVLWELKQAIIGAPRKDVLAMKKPHMQLHIPRAIEYWGCPSKTNTERFEAAHNPLTKQVYDVTSKNKDTTVSEMTIVGVSKTLAEHINHASCIAEQGMDYLLGLRPLVNDNLLYTCANNIKKWRLDYAIGSFSLLDDYLPITSRPKFWTATHRKNNTSLKSKKTLVSLLPTLITKDSFCKIVMNWFLEMNLMSKLEDGRNQVSLIGGLTIEGNDESGIEKVHIYATANFKSDKQTTASRRPKERYDFVEIQMCEGESQLAQVLAFLEITESGKRTKYIAVVAYLVPEILDENFAAKKMKNDSIPYLKKKHASPFFRRYQYAYLNTSTLQIEVIKAETIIGPAFVVRDFFSMGKGSRKHHRFNYVPRHFTDRSGWNPTESELTRHSLNVEDTSAFMKETVTSYDAGFITHGAEEFRLAIGEDDHVSETGRNKRKRGSLVDPDMNLSASPTIEFEGDDYGYF